MAHPDISDTAETDGDDPGPFLSDGELATLHRMAHQVDELYRRLAPLMEVAEAYARGGKLAANVSLRRMRKLWPAGTGGPDTTRLRMRRPAA